MVNLNKSQFTNELCYDLKFTYKYLGILEADTIKQVEMKDKIKKNISEELENYSRQNCLAETLSNK